MSDQCRRCGEESENLETLRLGCGVPEFEPTTGRMVNKLLDIVLCSLCKSKTVMNLKIGGMIEVISDFLISFVERHKSEQEHWFLYSDRARGVREYCGDFAEIRMNLDLLAEWLCTYPGKIESYKALPLGMQRKVWEASGFHFALCGFKKEEVDAYWDSRKVN